MTKYLVDFDSTLSNTFAAQLEYVNDKFGTAYKLENFTSWLSEAFMDPQHAAYMWGEDIFLSHAFQMSVEPVPHAIEGIQELLDRGDTVVVVSDRPLSLFYSTRKWLEKHGLDVPLELTHNKLSLAVPTRGGRTKAQVAWQNRLTHIVEDAPHHAEQFANRPFVEKVYLLDYPHNRNIAHDKITRIESWREIE